MKECKTCKHAKTCKSFVGTVWGFCNSDYTPNAYHAGKAQAIAEAQAWQQETSNGAQSWGELYEAQQHFAKLAKRYGLLKEFRENGIL